MPTPTDFYTRFPHLSGVTLNTVTSLLTSAIEQFDPSLPSYFDLVLLLVAHQITMDSLAMSDEIQLMVSSTGNTPANRNSIDNRSSLDRSAYGLEIQRITRSEVISAMYVP